MPGDALADRRLIAVTGAMGAGKTAVLETLGDRFAVMTEPGREVLAEARAAGGIAELEADSELFVSRLLEKSVAKYRAAASRLGPTLFDRGVPDCVAYAHYLSVDPTPFLEAARRYRYSDEVIVFPPWRDIYTTDEDRIMSFRDASRFHRLAVAAYREVGYSLIEVPRVDIEERSAFISRLLS